jgi:hypothetical protein
VPYSSKAVGYMPAKRWITFPQPGGHTNEDQQNSIGIPRDTATMQHYSREGDYLEELQKIEGILDVQEMFLSKLAIEENSIKGLSSENREEYVNGHRRSECSKWQWAELSHAKEEDLVRFAKEVIDAVEIMVEKQRKYRLS